PSASQVSVAWPSLMVARYSFSASVKCPSRRVALPIPATSTPVAMGSRVPPWPTRRGPAGGGGPGPTACGGLPPGLSTMTSPSAALTGLGPTPGAGAILVLFVVLVIGGDAVGIRVTGGHGPLPDLCQCLVGGPRPGDKFLHVVSVFGQGVLDEGQRWGVPQP